MFFWACDTNSYIYILSTRMKIFMGWHIMYWGKLCSRLGTVSHWGSFSNFEYSYNFNELISDTIKTTGHLFSFPRNVTKSFLASMTEILLSDLSVTDIYLLILFRVLKPSVLHSSWHMCVCLCVYRKYSSLMAIRIF